MRMSFIQTTMTSDVFVGSIAEPRLEVWGALQAGRGCAGGVGTPRPGNVPGKRVNMKTSYFNA